MDSDLSKIDQNFVLLKNCWFRVGRKSFNEGHPFSKELKILGFVAHHSGSIQDAIAEFKTAKIDEESGNVVFFELLHIAGYGDDLPFNRHVEFENDKNPLILREKHEQYVAKRRRA